MQNKEERRVVDVVNIKCQCCGKMIPGEAFVETVQGKKMMFCAEECHILYLDYFLGIR